MDRVAPAPLQRAVVAAYLLLAGAVLLTGVVTLWECYQLPSLGLSWNLNDDSVGIVQPGGPADGVVRTDDVLLRLNGLPFTRGGDVARITNSVRPGQPAELTVERDGKEQTLTIIPAAMDPFLEGHLVDYVGGAALWGLGLYVFLKRRTSTTARLFLLCCLAASIGLWGNLSLFVDPWYAALRRLTLSLLVPGLFLNLVVVLPHDHWTWRPARAFRLGYATLGLLLGLAAAAGALWMTDWSYPVYLLILGNQGLAFVIGVILVLLTYRSLPLGAARDRYRSAVTFLILGGLPFILMLMVGVGENFHDFDTRQATVAAVVLPFALAYVVLRYQFLGTRVAVRQVLTGALLLTSTITILVATYIAADVLLSLISPAYATGAALVVAALVAAVLFEPLRRRIRRYLEPLLDRRSVDLYEALGAFSRDLVMLQDLPSLQESLVRRLQAVFPRTRLLIALRDSAGETYQGIGTSDAAGAEQALTFSSRGALVGRLRQGDVLLSQQWAELSKHLPLEERTLVEHLQPEIVIPLLARPNDLLGWIALGAQGGRRGYDEREVEWLRGLAYQVSIAIANAQLYDQTAQIVRQLRQTNQQLAALQEIGVSLTGHLSLREVLQRVAQGVLSSGGFSSVWLGVANEQRTAIESVAYCRTNSQAQAQIESLIGHAIEGASLDLLDDDNPVVRAIRQGEIGVFHDLQGLGYPLRDAALIAQVQQISGNQTYVAMPLRTGDAVVGTLVVGSPRPALPPSEIESLRTFAYQAALAIENARLWEETDEKLRQRVRELTTLHAIAEAVNSTLDLDEVLDRALSRILAVTRFDAGLIALLDEVRRLQPVTSHHVPSSLLELLRGSGPDFVAQVLHATLTVDNVETSPVPAERSVFRDAGLRAFCIVPLVAREKPVGILGLGIRQEQTLAREDLALAEAVAQQVSIAIANARLYEEAAEERQKIETILQSVGDGVCTTDRERIVLSLNAAVAQLLGWQEHEAIGHPCSEVLRCQDANGRPRCDGACPLLVAMQQRRYEYPHLGDWFVRTYGGQLIPIWGVAGPLVDPSGTVLGGVLALRDAAREAEMERLQSEFISMISHEVRTPLTNLKAAAQLIARWGDRQDEDTRANLARIVSEQCDRLDRLVQQVEDSVQFQASRLNLQIAPIYLPALVRDVIQSVPSRDNPRTFEVLLTDEPELWALGDGQKVRVVLNNLLDNAAKYSQRQGTITVKVALWDPAQVLVSVLDEGPRIASEQRERVFTRFYRIDNTDARTVYGLGLGLDIARALVSAQGGRIWVDGEDGPGNRFCFTLPRSQAGPPSD